MKHEHYAFTKISIGFQNSIFTFNKMFMQRGLRQLPKFCKLTKSYSTGSFERKIGGWLSKYTRKHTFILLASGNRSDFQGIFRDRENFTDNIANLVYLNEQYLDCEMSTFWRVLIEMELHCPTRTKVDLKEFLDGATYAADLLFHFIYSPTFRENIQSDVPELTSQINELVSSTCFQTIRNAAADPEFDRILENIEFDDCSISDVRFTKRIDYHGGKSMPGHENEKDEKIERNFLAIDVNYCLTKHFSQSIGSDKEVFSNVNWTFESEVDAPDIVNWKIVRMNFT